jgi:8-hydroxy-5-deazaflavin:NADPH oxidoreductase
MKVTIIGAGNMGRAIGTRAVSGGHQVEVVDRSPEDARTLAQELGSSASVVDAGSAFSGDIVVLAFYYPDTLQAIDAFGDGLRGKPVVEISNPVDRETWDRLATSTDKSAAEEAAERLGGGARVVKAFNTTFGTTLVAGEVSGQQLDVLIAGDDEGAKAAVAELVTSGGLRPIDVGPLERARQLEQLGFLHIAIQEPLGWGYSSAVKFHAP